MDVFCDQEDLEAFVTQAGLHRDHSDFYIQVCSGLNFRTSPRWGTRTRTSQIGNCTFIFPHPIDILIAKLNRLEEKDLRAFRVVIEKTGHPTEAELIHELQMAVDLFRPGFEPDVFTQLCSPSSISRSRNASAAVRNAPRSSFDGSRSKTQMSGW